MSNISWVFKIISMNTFDLLYHSAIIKKKFRKTHNNAENPTKNRPSQLCFY